MIKGEGGVLRYWGNGDLFASSRREFLSGERNDETVGYYAYGEYGLELLCMRGL